MATFNRDHWYLSVIVAGGQGEVPAVSVYPISNTPVIYGATPIREPFATATAAVATEVLPTVV
jgi:hypothetical protein